MRGYLGLSCPPIDGVTQQPTKSRLRVLRVALEGRRGWVGICGKDGCLSFGMERQKNKEMGGPLAFDGRHLMRGHNNQIKVGVDVGGGIREKRRPRKNVWGGCCHFVPGRRIEDE